jgi:hypothetical protein
LEQQHVCSVLKVISSTPKQSHAKRVQVARMHLQPKLSFSARPVRWENTFRRQEASLSMIALDVLQVPFIHDVIFFS